MGRFTFSRLLMDREKHRVGVASSLERVHLALLSILICFIGLGHANAQFAQQGSKLVGTGAVGNAAQGTSVSLSSDGNTAIVGGYDDNSTAGAAWVFIRLGGIWTQQGSKLFGTGAVGSQLYQGYSVSLSSDGYTAIVGGSGDNSNLGAAWIYATPNAPMAVELTLFSVTSRHLNADLHWKTATEVNNYGFEVEKRRIQTTASSGQEEAAKWTQSGFVEGAGTSAVPREYTFTDKNLTASKYEFRLKQIDRDGSFHYSQSVEVEVAIAPRVFELSQNYPNPFNPSTEIKFSVATTAHAMVSVYNLIGEQIALLYDGNAEAGQYYSVKLDGSRLSSSMYLYRLQSASFIETKKLMLVK